MLTLNLLPDYNKHEYNLEKKRRFILYISLFLCGIMIIFNVLLGSVYVFLLTYRQSINKSAEVQMNTDAVKHLSVLEKEINELNKDIGEFTKIESQRISITPVVESIARLVTQDMYLKNIAVEESTKKVNITGFAKTRDVMLSLDRALQHSDIVEEGSWYNSIKNSLKKESVSFTFSFIFKANE